MPRSMAAQAGDDDDVAPILRGIRPSGWVGASAAALLTVPIATLLGAQAALKYLMGPRLPPKDRSRPLPDPLPGLVRAMVQVAPGVRLMTVSPGRKPDKPLMLMIHGFPECWYSWRHQMARFKDDYDVVAVDMRGYGESDKPPGVDNYHLRQLVADVGEVVVGLGHSTCTLVAHDWGGVAAWLAAAVRPGVVDRLVVMAAPHLGLSSVNMDLRQAMMSWYILLFQAPWLPEHMLLANDAKMVADAVKHGPLGVRDKTKINDDSDVEWMKQAIQRPGAAHASVNYYRALLRNSTTLPDDSVWRLMRRRIWVPVLVLWGQEDGALSSVLMNNLEQVAEDSELHVLPRCSHWVQQDQPEETNRIMHAFLERTQGAVRRQPAGKL